MKKNEEKEKYIKENLENFVTSKPEYLDFISSADNIETFYHGSPFKFNSFLLPDDLEHKSGVYDCNGISFATTKKEAEPFSRQFTDVLYEKIKELDEKYPNMGSLLRKQESMKNSDATRENIESKLDWAKNAYNEQVKSINKNIEEYRDGLFPDYTVLTHKERNPYAFKYLDEVKNKVKKYERGIENLLTIEEDKIIVDYNKKRAEIESTQPEYIYVAHIKYSDIVSRRGEDIGFSSYREEIVDNLDKNQILKISDADTGQYIGTEVIVSNIENVFIINQPKYILELGEIWELKNKDINVEDAKAEIAKAIEKEKKEQRNKVEAVLK